MEPYLATRGQRRLYAETQKEDFQRNSADLRPVAWAAQHQTGAAACRLDDSSPSSLHSRPPITPTFVRQRASSAVCLVAVADAQGAGRWSLLRTLESTSSQTNGPLKAPPRKTAMVSGKSVLFRWHRNTENGATCRVLPAVAPGCIPLVAFPRCERGRTFVCSLARINWRGWRVGEGGDAMLDRSQLVYIQRLQAFARRA